MNILCTRLAFAFLLVGAPSAGLTCSCMGTSPIAEEIERADAVIVGRALRFAPTDGKFDWRPMETTVVEVVEAIKGDLTGEVHVTRFSNCYQSLPSDELQVGRTYVLPLYKLALQLPPSSVDAVSLQGKPYPGLPLDRVFELPECAESGILLRDGQTFTPALLEGGDRRVLRYLSRDIILVILGGLSIIGVIAWQRSRRRGQGSS